MRECRERLLQMLDGLFVRRLVERLFTCGKRIAAPLVPYRSIERVTRQFLDVVLATILVTLFQRPHYYRMHEPAPFRKQAAIGNLQGERVFEGVFRIR